MRSASFGSRIPWQEQDSCHSQVVVRQEGSLHARRLKTTTVAVEQPFQQKEGPDRWEALPGP